MKARKKPIVIDVVVFDLTQPHLGVDLREQNGLWQVYNLTRDEWTYLGPGDLLNVTDLNDVYPISSEYFADHYEIVE